MLTKKKKIWRWRQWTWSVLIFRVHALSSHSSCCNIAHTSCPIRAQGLTSCQQVAHEDADRLWCCFFHYTAEVLSHSCSNAPWGQSGSIGFSLCVLGIKPPFHFLFMPCSCLCKSMQVCVQVSLWASKLPSYPVSYPYMYLMCNFRTSDSMRTNRSAQKWRNFFFFLNGTLWHFKDWCRQKRLCVDIWDDFWAWTQILHVFLLDI